MGNVTLVAITWTNSVMPYFELSNVFIFWCPIFKLSSVEIVWCAIFISSNVLIFWCPIFKLSYCKSFEDRVPVYFIYVHPMGGSGLTRMSWWQDDSPGNDVPFPVNAYIWCNIAATLQRACWRTFANGLWTVACCIILKAIWNSRWSVI